MPQLGESVVEGTVAVWLKKVGDHVDEYEPLVEVSTDKVTTEIPSPASGMLLAVYVQEDETVTAGTVLCVIGEAGERLPERASAVPTQAGNGHMTPVEARIQVGSRPSRRLSPVVARMAAEHQLDISQITGTGIGGRVTKKDVEAYLQRQQPSSLPPWEQPGSGDLFKPTEALPEVSPPAATPTPQPPAMPARAIPIEAVPQGVPGELIKLTQIRRAIAKHMVESKLEIAPHVTTVFEIDMGNVLKHLEIHKPQVAKQGVNLTLTAYFIQAMVAACRAVPIINSQWTDEGIYLHYAINVGMAVAIEDGLIVPVIQHAEDLNLIGIARKVNDLAQRARNNQLKPEEVKGGTISITNHGVSGSLFATPIINQPQSAIFGVGIVEKRVKVIDDAIAIRPCCYATLTFDHRVADGASGDAWMMVLKRTLENWQVE
jgi:2-oxoglutarate dehydrogenase E2 component (dihydrolipoamide succinyltransferase)